MLNIFNKQSLLALSIAVAVIAGCKKEGMHTTVATGPKPVLTATNTGEMVLTADTKDSVIQKLSFTPTTFGYNAVITYVLQFDKKGNGFSKAQNVTVTSTSYSITIAALNTTAAALKLTFGEDNDMVVRVKATVGSNQLLADATSYSDSIVMVVNPYKVLPVYTQVYVPGSYTTPSWDPPTAPALADVESDKIYQGYLLFITNSEFKVNVSRNWTDANYGGTATTLSTSSPDNLKLATGGLYFMQANLNDFTWSAAAISSFSANGTATANADVDFTATDATKTKYSATVNLSAGTFFIRANHANTLAYGDTDGDQIAEVATATNGIAVATAGSYVITFDVSLPGIYQYTLTPAL